MLEKQNLHVSLYIYENTTLLLECTLCGAASI